MATHQPPGQPGDQRSAEPFGTMIVRGAWAARRAGVGAIDPRLIRSHRFHHENPALALALITVISSTAVASILISDQVALLVIGAIVAQAIVVRFQVKALVGRAAEVTPAQFANLHTIVTHGLEALDLPATRVFVVQDPNPNAFAFGFSRPYGIVLSSALVEALDEQELSAVIGHEMGHIKLGHTRFTLLFGGVDVPLGIPLIQILIRAPFLWWMRCSELSADRAGYAVSGRVSKIISTLVKIAIGPRLYSQVRPDELARQADEFYRGPWAVISQLQSSHPFLISRIQQIIDFAGPPEQGHDLNLARPDGLTAMWSAQDMREAQRSSPAASATPYQPSPPPASQPAPAQRRPLEPVSNIPTWADAEQQAPPPAAWLARSALNGEHEWVPLSGAWMTVGRGNQNDLVAQDPKISLRHFGIQWDGVSYTLHDLNSRNGTRLNGQPTRTAVLRTGDEIQVGDSRFTFSTGG